jgi:signal peptidase II
VLQKKQKVPSVPFAGKSAKQIVKDIHHNLKMLKNNMLNFFLLVFIFVIDRLSKIYILGLDEIINGNTISVNKFLNLELVWNRGVAFGILSFQESFWYNIITILIFVIIIILIYLIFSSSGFKKYSYIAVCGGALGNVFDRILYNSVPDFIDLNYNDFHWFIFNVADIFITIGVFCLIFDEIIIEKYKNEKNK